MQTAPNSCTLMSGALMGGLGVPTSGLSSMMAFREVRFLTWWPRAPHVPGNRS